MHEDILMKISDIKDQSMYKKVRGGIFPKMKTFLGGNLKKKKSKKKRIFFFLKNYLKFRKFLL